MSILACPHCASALVLEGGEPPTGEVTSGRLACESCGRTYPIVRSVPRLVPSDVSAEQQRTGDAFGWQWQHFAEVSPAHEEQFLDWIHPLEPSFFADKDVLDAGCGSGRLSNIVVRYGARELVAVDIGGAVESAAANLSEFSNAHVVQGDILRLPLRGPDDDGGFDVIYSIGVLHHLPRPRDGFLALARWLRPGGTLVVWVYGYENNGVVRNVVEPLRRLTTALPPPLLRAVAWPIAVVFHALVKGVYGPARGTAWGRFLPVRDYISSLASFGFRHNYTIVFDQLVAPTAAYIRGDELRSWFADAELVDVEVTSRHGNSWRGRGTRCLEEADAA